jgi:hypothetical protein
MAKPADGNFAPYRSSPQEIGWVRTQEIVQVPRRRAHILTLGRIHGGRRDQQALRQTSADAVDQAWRIPVAPDAHAHTRRHPPTVVRAPLDPLACGLSDAIRPAADQFRPHEMRRQSRCRRLCGSQSVSAGAASVPRTRALINRCAQPQGRTVVSGPWRAVNGRHRKRAQRRS